MLPPGTCPVTACAEWKRPLANVEGAFLDLVADGVTHRISFTQQPFRRQRKPDAETGITAAPSSTHRQGDFFSRESSQVSSIPHPL